MEGNPAHPTKIFSPLLSSSRAVEIEVLGHLTGSSRGWTPLSPCPSCLSRLSLLHAQESPSGTANYIVTLAQFLNLDCAIGSVGVNVKYGVLTPTTEILISLLRCEAWVQVLFFKAFTCFKYTAEAEKHHSRSKPKLLGRTSRKNSFKVLIGSWHNWEKFASEMFSLGMLAWRLSSSSHLVWQG